MEGNTTNPNRKETEMYERVPDDPETASSNRSYTREEWEADRETAFRARWAAEGYGPDVTAVNRDCGNL
jgi:hypothetical protein